MRGSGGAHIQIWRFSDLTLLQTIALPSTAAGDGHIHDGSLTVKDEAHHFLPGEPRVLGDGRTVLLATFTCGFYRVTGIDGPAPKVDFLRAFGGVMCAVPVIAGPYWVQTVPDEHALVALDVTDSAHPREVARVTFDSTFKPHWLALDEGGSRVVVNDGKERVMLVAFDRRTGALVVDAAFRDEGATAPGVSFARGAWPHGETGPAKPHGSVFAR
jgi:hypothetical protein